jgi:alpha-L-fucosidase
MDAGSDPWFREATMRTILPLLLSVPGVFASGAPARAAERPVEPTWASVDARPTPGWFEDARFGIFIHWGVYSVPAFAPTRDVDIYARYAEWYWKRLTTPDMEGHALFEEFHDRVYGPRTRYQDFAPRFTAEMYDPKAWAEIFARAGARYVVLTSKHHDGFCLWPSAESWNWNAVDVGPHRDLAGDLAEAVRAKGLKMGFYYSLYEWFNPLYAADVDRYVETHMLPQMRDLVTRYRPDILWTDGEWDHPSATWRAPEFLAWLFDESPVASTVAVNDRWGKETRALHGGFYTTEYGRIHQRDASGDVIPHPWEECRGIGHSFGYNRAERLADYASPEKLISLLADTVSRGGNLLLDIGPTADGRIPVIMEERLLQMGHWLETNGEAIYGTRRWRVTSEGDAVRYTSREGTVFAIHLGWPGSALTLEAPEPTPATRVRLLGAEGPLKWRRAKGGLQIERPKNTPVGALAYVFALTGVK